MQAVPFVIRSKRQNAKKRTYNQVGFLGFKERTMPAIVKNDKHANQKSGGKNQKNSGKPVRYGKTVNCCYP
jgi:hypothetical protein